MSPIQGTSQRTGWRCEERAAYGDCRAMGLMEW
jgi:hypothetical protein